MRKTRSGGLRIAMTLAVTLFAVDANAATLEERVAALEAKLASMYVTTIHGQPAVVFQGVNLHLRNGEGSTSAVNGTGNFVIGYNSGSSQTRAGSHNLVLGDGNEYTAQAYGAMVSGFSSLVGAPYAVALGGYNNNATGPYSVAVTTVTCIEPL